MCRGGAVVYEMEDFFGYDSRFAGTGAGEDELEAAGFYCGFLGGVEGHLLEIGGDAGKRWRGMITGDLTLIGAPPLAAWASPVGIYLI